MSRFKHSKKAKPFVKIDQWILATLAWRDLDPPARALYVELKQRYNGTNNGFIGLGIREAGKAINVGKNVAADAFTSLEDHGFIAVAADSKFDQKRRSREWRITEARDDRANIEPTKDFASWRPEKQNAVPPAGHIVPPTGHKNTRGNKKSAYSPVTGTIDQDLEHPQSRQRDTYISTAIGGGR